MVELEGMTEVGGSEERESGSGKWIVVWFHSQTSLLFLLSSYLFTLKRGKWCVCPHFPKLQLAQRILKSERTVFQTGMMHFYRPMLAVS